MSKFVSAIIVAAGDSLRMGVEDSKQFIPLLGKPAIEYMIGAFQKCILISEIVIVCREQDKDRIKVLAQACGFSKVCAIVEGGDSRAQSVKNGIEAASGDCEFFAIHDGARPLVSVDEIERVISAAFEIGAASLGTLVTDTIKTVDDSNIITSTPARSELRAVQTPQVFEKELYRLAIDEARGDLSEFTDDCALIENLGGEVEIVEGSSENIKLTTPIDIVIAESILKNRLG